MDKVEDCLKQLGDYFIGLWTYQAYSRTTKKDKTYCATVCIKGNHYDTKSWKTPLKAVQEAVKIMMEEKNHES